MKESDNGKSAHEKAASEWMPPVTQKQRPTTLYASNPQAESGGVMSIAEHRRG